MPKEYKSVKNLSEDQKQERALVVAQSVSDYTAGLPEPVGTAGKLSKKNLLKIRQFMAQGLSKSQACALVGVTIHGLNKYINEKDAEFGLSLDGVRDIISGKAVENIFSAIANGDLETSKYVADRRDRRFNPRQINENLNINVDLGAMFDESERIRKSGEIVDAELL